MIPDSRALQFWARTAVHVWPEQYLLVSLKPDLWLKAAELVATTSGKFAALVMERDEVSLTIEREVWQADPLRLRAVVEDGPFRAITLDVDVDLDVVGYLAAASTALADAGVPIIPQCARLKDHLLVHDRDLKTAIEALNNVIQRSRQPS